MVDGAMMYVDVQNMMDKIDVVGTFAAVESERLPVSSMSNVMSCLGNCTVSQKSFHL